MPAVNGSSSYPKARVELDSQFAVAEFSTHRKTLKDAFQSTLNTLKSQVVTLYNGATGGSFTLTHEPTEDTSSAIDFDATSAEVETALDAITALDGLVTVSGPAGGPWIITANPGDLLDQLLVATPSLTGGASPTVVVKHLIDVTPDRDQAMDELFVAASRAAEGLRQLPTPPANAWTPASHTATVLWLDANHAATVLSAAGQAQNGQAVTSWVDRIAGSISFAEVSGSGPTLKTDGPNSTRYLRDDGAAKYLRYAASSALNHSAGDIFIVARPRSVTGLQCLFASADEASTSRSLSVLFNNLAFECSQNNAGTADRLAGEDRGPLDGFCLLNVRSDGSETFIAVNGFDQDLTASTGSNAGDWFAETSARDNVTLFALRTSAIGNYFNGDIAEVIVTNAHLSDVERSYFLAYLREKYTPLVQVAALGDSHTAGPGGIIDSAGALVSLLNASPQCGISVVNHGVGGEEIGECRTRWTSDIRSHGYDVLILLAGTNDVVATTAGEAEATLFPLLEATYDEALADGLRVIAITVYPFYGHDSWSQTRQTELAVLNRLIREKAAKTPGMWLVDAYQLLGDPNEPRRIRPTYDFTGTNYLHTNAAGDAVIAAEIYSALRKMFS
jgi:lysophospholipase L1-like esterase